MIISKKGDPYDEEALHRDFMALWNTGRFDDIRMEREVGKTGWIVRFTVVERRIVRSIKYDGLKSITQSEILDRFQGAQGRVERGIAVRSEQDSSARATFCRSILRSGDANSRLWNRKFARCLHPLWN